MSQLRFRGATVALLVGAVIAVPGLGSSARAMDSVRAQRGEAIPTVNRVPTTILASRLSLSGLGYDGLVDVPATTGDVTALKFTLDSLRLDDVTVSVPTDRSALRITGRYGQVRTSSSEQSTIYLRQLKGKLKIGPIPVPVDFTPENPPPLSFPWLIFDDVTIGLYLLDGGDLTVPDATMTVGGEHIPLPEPTDAPAPSTDTPAPHSDTPAPSSAESNPYTPEELCGAGYQVIDSHDLGSAATIHLLRNPDSRHHCVVTRKKRSLGSATSTSAFLEVQGSQRRDDSGRFAYYAGPVRVAAGTRCVRWGGSAGSVSYAGPFEHCS